MSFQITTTVTCYLLPDDGPAAQQAFLQHLMSPGETWITAYAFTLPDMIQDLIAAHKQGIPLHLYLDYSQSIDATEHPLVAQLVAAGVEVTIGTSPAGSEFICHTKGIVSDAPQAGGPTWCWEGSTNFSLDAWKQVNTALVFSSTEWRNEFVAQFEGLVNYAWANERNLQLMKNPPPDLGKAPAANRIRYGLTPRPAPGARAGQSGATAAQKPPQISH
jgi:PLD-like domain